MNDSQGGSGGDRSCHGIFEHERFHDVAGIPRRQPQLSFLLLPKNDFYVEESLGAEFEWRGNAGEDQKSRSVVRGGPRVGDGFSDDREDEFERERFEGGHFRDERGFGRLCVITAFLLARCGPKYLLTMHYRPRASVRGAE